MSEMLVVGLAMVTDQITSKGKFSLCLPSGKLVPGQCAAELFSRTWYGEMERYRFSKNP